MFSSSTPTLLQRETTCPRNRQSGQGLGCREVAAWEMTHQHSSIQGDRREARGTRTSYPAPHESVYTPVYLDTKNYITDFGGVHHAKAKMGEGNVLVEFNANKVVIFFA